MTVLAQNHPLRDRKKEKEKYKYTPFMNPRELQNNWEKIKVFHGRLTKIDLLSQPNRPFTTFYGNY